MAQQKHPAEERIEALRAQIPTLRYSAYFDYASHGPIPDAVLASMFNAYEEQHRLGPSSIQAGKWAEERVDLARTATAGALGAAPDRIAFGPGVSALCSTVLWGIGWRAGDRLVLGDGADPSIAAAASNLQSRAGVEVVRWRAQLSEDEMLEDLRGALRERTRLAIVSHVLQDSGETMPVRRIADLCHRRDPPVSLFVDGSQSFAAMPVAPGELRADYFAAPGRRWLCGPDGVAVLYARDPDALAKLDSPPYPALAAFREALSLHESVAPAADRYRLVQARTAALRGGLDEIASRTSGVAVVTRPGVGAGIVSFRLLSHPHEDLVRALETRHILVRAIPDPPCVRVSAHYFTSEQELGLLLQAVEDFLRRRM